MQRWEHSSEKEKQNLAAAIDTLKKGRFQAFPREINKLQKNAKRGPVALAVQLRSLLQILSKHLPKVEEADARDRPDTGNGPPTKAANDLPRVIISQSYV